MPFVPAENTVEVEFVYLWQDQIVENTLYFQSDSAWSAPGMADLYDALHTWWSDNIQPLQGADISLQEVKITDLTTETALSLTFTTGLPAAGGASGEPMPSGTTLAVSFRTAGRGRSSRGRNYWLGLTENQVAGNIVSGSLVTAIRDAYDLLRGSTFIDLSAVFSVVSRFHDLAPRTTALVQPITSVTIVDPFVDSQRRRLAGRGR